MKYFSLHALILAGLALFLTGCFRDYDYDLTRNHDIYRMHYNYTPLPDQSPAPAAAGAPAAPDAAAGLPPQQPAVPPVTQ